MKLTRAQQAAVLAVLVQLEDLPRDQWLAVLDEARREVKSRRK